MLVASMSFLSQRRMILRVQSHSCERLMLWEQHKGRSQTDKCNHDVFQAALDTLLEKDGISLESFPGTMTKQDEFRLESMAKSWCTLICRVNELVRHSMTDIATRCVALPWLPKI